MPGDAPGLSRLRSDDRVNRFLERPGQTSVTEAGAFIEKINNSIAEGNSYYWVICIKGETSVSGTICIWNISEDRKTAEIGYELHPDFQGKGLMSEALEALVRFAFHNAGITRLEAYTHKDNHTSSRLLQKHGFTIVPGKSDPENENLVIYSLQYVK